MLGSQMSRKRYRRSVTQAARKGVLVVVELIVSDGLTGIVSAAETVYPAARHQRCLAHWFRNLEALTPRLAWFHRRKSASRCSIVSCWPPSRCTTKESYGPEHPSTCFQQKCWTVPSVRSSLTVFGGIC